MVIEYPANENVIDRDEQAAAEQIAGTIWTHLEPKLCPDRAQLAQGSIERLVSDGFLVIYGAPAPNLNARPLVFRTSAQEHFRLRVFVDSKRAGAPGAT
jgi:hypothetical protein